MIYRFATGLDLDEVTMKCMGDAAAAWFAERTDGRRRFLCGAGVRGEPLIAVLVTEPGEDAHILIRLASLDEMLQRLTGQ